MYPTVYQPGVRAVNFHEMRGGSFATGRTSASSVKCSAGANVQVTLPSGRVREPVVRTSLTEPAWYTTSVMPLPLAARQRGNG